ncbi:MAG: response regulator transcription factor [Deltaproteobacteria bacterium]|nr:response regulator transcription factor [Deltaproteobacteria bacterium]MBW2088112.1 response regulator transcription factor [Deltaproteobacteria bacterium]
MRILVVEDDKGTARFIKKGLSEEGFMADVVSGGEEGLFMATTEIYDLIILDVMLPVINGFEVLRAVRKKGVSTPVLFLTAKDEKEDIIHGLDLGADDYLVKPFAFAELLARVRAVLRRGQPGEPIEKLVVGDLVLDRVARQARREDKIIELTAKEFQLLEYMMRNTGQILTKTMILDRVWGYDFDTQSNIIQVHVNRLRAKVDKDFSTKLIHTVRGIGYVIKTQG